MTPVRIVPVTDRLVRFYRSPLDGPDFPWVSFADVAGLTFLSAELQQEARERWGAAYPDLVRQAAEDVTIVPDLCPRGLFEWCAEQGWEPAPAVARAYDEAASAVLTSLYGSLPLSVLLDFTRKAALRNCPVERVGYAN